MIEPKVTPESLPLLIACISSKDVNEFKRNYRELILQVSGVDMVQFPEMPDGEAAKLHQTMIDGSLDLILKMKNDGTWDKYVKK